MTDRVRDFQRSRVYRAEREAFGDTFEAYRERMVPRANGRWVDSNGVRLARTRTWRADALRSVAECQAFVDSLELPFPIVVASGKARRKGGAYQQRGVATIALPLWARVRPVILHEVAHHIANGDRHGPAFTQAYVALVTETLGKDAGGRLHRAFREHRVKVGA